MTQKALGEIELLKKLSIDLKGYSQKEIDDALNAESSTKFGIIDKFVVKIQEELNKLNPEDRKKILSGEIKFGIQKRNKKIFY